MDAQTEAQIDDSSDQELVDLYAAHALEITASAMTDVQVLHASAAAEALESRGYVERAGTWLHATRPELVSAG